MSQELTSAAGSDRTSTHQAPGVSAEDQAEIDFWTAALEEHSNRAMLNISRQALAKLLGIIGKLRTEQRAQSVCEVFNAKSEQMGFPERLGSRRCEQCKRDMGIEPSAHIGEDFCDTCFAVESGDV